MVYLIDLNYPLSLVNEAKLLGVKESGSMFMRPFMVYLILIILFSLYYQA